MIKIYIPFVNRIVGLSKMSNITFLDIYWIPEASQGVLQVQQPMNLDLKLYFGYMNRMINMSEGLQNFKGKSLRSYDIRIQLVFKLIMQFYRIWIQSDNNYTFKKGWQNQKQTKIIINDNNAFLTIPTQYLKKYVFLLPLYVITYQSYKSKEHKTLKSWQPCFHFFVQHCPLNKFLN